MSVPAQAGAKVVMPAASAATTATQSMVFSRAGHDYATIEVLIGTHATNEAAIGTLKITEHDSSTDITDHSDIVAFTGGTATSTSAGFVIPGAATVGFGAIVQFQIDLRKRKKILALQITPGTTTMQIGAIATLTRSAQSADTAAQKSVTNSVLTDITSVARIVTG